MFHKRNTCYSRFQEQDRLFLCWPQVTACCSQLISKDLQNAQVLASSACTSCYLTEKKRPVIWCKWFTTPCMYRLLEKHLGMEVLSHLPVSSWRRSCQHKVVCVVQAIGLSVAWSRRTLVGAAEIFVASSPQRFCRSSLIKILAEDNCWRVVTSAGRGR